MTRQEEVKQRLYQIGIIPAIVLNDVKDAAPLAEALCKGGLPAAEVTYRTDCAHDAMIEMKKARPDLLVGAGTVLTKEQVDSAIDAGAEFIVSPGLNPEVVKYAQSKNVVVIPGTSCASDIEQALALGLDVVKFFPAEALGGIKTIKALCGPYTTMRFMPTGGVNEGNMNDYLTNPKIYAVGGTWMVKADDIKAGNFDRIEELSRKAVLKMLDVRVKKVSLSSEGDNARVLADLGVIEPTSGEGTLTIGVNNVERALAYFKGIGAVVDEASILKDGTGLAAEADLSGVVGGFRVHITKN